MIKVSVIVPTYNRDKYIKKCIDSLINQTLKDIEILIIDDGSTDNTKNIVTSYDDDRIKYFYKDNSGIGDTRNFGIKKAKGNYLCFVDSDDYIDKKMLEKCYEKALKDDLDMVVCDYIEFNEDNKKQVKFHLNSFENTTLKNNPKLILDVNLGPCNKLFKKELFKEDLFPIDIKYEDMALMVKIMHKAKKIGKIDEYLSYFLVHSNSETTTLDKRVFDIFVSLDMIKNTLKDKVYLDNLKQLIVRKLGIYNIQQRYQKSHELRTKFINQSFTYLKENVIDYKSSKYYQDRGFLRKNIERSKFLTKLYVEIYAIFH